MKEEAWGCSGPMKDECQDDHKNGEPGTHGEQENYCAKKGHEQLGPGKGLADGRWFPWV